MSEFKEYEARKEESPKRKIIIGVVFSIISIIIIGALLLASYFNDPERLFTENFAEGNYNELEELYYRMNYKQKEETSRHMLKEAKKVIDSYNIDEISFEEAEEKVTLFLSFVDSESAESLNATLYEIKDSKEIYNEALELESKENYKEAIIYFEKVIEEDNNYNSSREKIETVKSLYKEKLLKAINDFYSKEDYEAGLTLAQEGLKTLSEDTELQEKVSELKEAKENKKINDILVLAEEKANEKDYRSAIKKLEEIKNKNNANADAKMAEYKSAYKSLAFEEAKIKANAHDYEEAVSILKEANLLLSDDEISEKVAAYEECYPVSLFTLSPYVKNNTVYIEENLKDNFGNQYDKGFYVYGVYGGWKRYDLGQKYNRLTGTLAVESTNTSESGVFQIMTDGKIIWEKKGISGKTKPIEIDLDITGVTDLTIYLKANYNTDFMFADVYLQKLIES